MAHYLQYCLTIETTRSLGIKLDELVKSLL